MLLILACGALLSTSCDKEEMDEYSGDKSDFTQTIKEETISGNKKVPIRRPCDRPRFTNFKGAGSELPCGPVLK